MSTERIDLTDGVVQAIAEFQKRCIGKGPARVQARLVGDLMVANSAAPPTPSEEKLLVGGVKSIHCAKTKRLHRLKSKHSIIAYLIENSTGRRVSSGDIFVHTDFSHEKGYWMDVFVFALDRDAGEGRWWERADDNNREVQRPW